MNRLQFLCDAWNPRAHMAFYWPEMGLRFRCIRKENWWLPKIVASSSLAPLIRDRKRRSFHKSPKMLKCMHHVWMQFVLMPSYCSFKVFLFILNTSDTSISSGQRHLSELQPAGMAAPMFDFDFDFESLSVILYNIDENQVCRALRGGNALFLVS